MFVHLLPRQGTYLSYLPTQHNMLFRTYNIVTFIQFFSISSLVYRKSFMPLRSVRKQPTHLLRPRPYNLSRGCRAPRGAEAGSRSANLKMPPQSLRIDTRRVTCRQRRPMAAYRRRGEAPLSAPHRQCTRTRRPKRTYAARATQQIRVSPKTGPMHRDML